MGLFHERYDLLLTPTMPIAAFEAGREVPPGSPSPRWMSWTPFTYPFNMTQQPAASLPCGLTSGGLPVGLRSSAPGTPTPWSWPRAPPTRRRGRGSVSRSREGDDRAAPVGALVHRGEEARGVVQGDGRHLGDDAVRLREGERVAQVVR